MKKSISITALILLIIVGITEVMFSQTIDSIPLKNGKKLALTSLKDVSIFTKHDGRIKVIKIKEINSNSIVFEKNETLHDYVIENIDYIEFNSSYAIIFNNENLPVIKSLSTHLYDVPKTEIKKDTVVQELLLKSDSSFVKINNSYTNSEINQKLHTDSMEYYLKLGISDSKKYYTGNYAFAGGIVSGVFFPVGWIPEIIIASTPAKQSCFGLDKNPNKNLYETNSWYKKGYKRAAHCKKAGMAILGFLAGIAADMIIINVRQNIL